MALLTDPANAPRCKKELIYNALLPRKAVRNIIATALRLKAIYFLAAQA